jgi:hypothetical protein
VISDVLPVRSDPAEPFRQGTVLTFNAATGANTISVAGGVLTDVPMAENSGVVNLAAGDAVILLKMRSSWAILGKVLPAGGGDFAASAVAFAQDLDFDDNFATLLGPAELTPVSVTLAVPSWANEALVTATACMSAINSTASTRGMYAGVTIGGVGGGWGSATSIPAGLQGASSATRSRTIVSPGATITVSGTIFTSAIFAANVANQAMLTATAIYRRA